MYRWPEAVSLHDERGGGGGEDEWEENGRAVIPGSSFRHSLSSDKNKYSEPKNTNTTL